MNIFSLFSAPIANVLMAFYHLLLYIHMPFAMGFAIIFLTAFIRILMWPILSAQIKQAVQMQKMNPHLATIREKHKDDKKKQQEEMMKLYKEHGVNPASGCVTAIVQLLVFSSLYTVLMEFATANTAEGITKINKLLFFPALHLDPSKKLDTMFFGLSLSDTPQKLFNAIPLIVFIPLLTAALQFVLSKMMIPVSTPTDKEKKKDDFATAFQTQSLFIFPAMIGFFAFSLPIGMALYWNTFTIFGILQQYLLAGPGGLTPWINKIKSK